MALATARQSAAERIDGWHKQRSFARRPYNVSKYNSHLHHIGYHFVIDVDGTLETGRAEGETGAHVKGHNTGSIGICMTGTDKFTLSQWRTLMELVTDLHAAYPEAAIAGIATSSPILTATASSNHWEWLKICPGFDVADRLQSGMEPLPEHITEIVA